MYYLRPALHWQSSLQRKQVPAILYHLYGHSL
nr:MAG TPA: hypothetical protein [Caudoviricetes sp.]